MTEVYKNNMNFFMRALYRPVAKSEPDQVTIPDNWEDYPALRTPALAGVKPPAGKVLVKTGGNALQAIDRKALEQKNVMAVTVPWNTGPGDEMLVRLPQDRLIRTRVPEGMQPGHVFLLRVPEPTVVTGVPVEIRAQDANVVPSQEVNMAPGYVPPNDLQLDEMSGDSNSTQSLV